MNCRIDWIPRKRVGLVLSATLVMFKPVVADEANAVSVVKMVPDKLAGINLPTKEPFFLRLVIGSRDTTRPRAAHAVFS